MVLRSEGCFTCMDTVPLKKCRILVPISDGSVKDAVFPGSPIIDQIPCMSAKGIWSYSPRLAMARKAATVFRASLANSSSSAGLPR